MAFVANLFNNFPGLPPMDEEEQEQEEEEPYEETREDLSKALELALCRTWSCDLLTLKFKTWHFVSTRNVKSRKN